MQASPSVHPLAPLVVALSVLVAGCLSGAPEQAQGRKVARIVGSAATSELPWVDPGRPIHQLETLFPFSTKATDGTILRGHVYLPNGSGPFATVLQLSPYWNTHPVHGHSEGLAITKDGRRTMGLWLTPFMDAGFAVAAINLRGTGESDGCLQWNSKTDWSDAATVVEALAAQPWSNGNIGMFGLSYDGWTQYMALAGAAPHLKAIIPVSGVIDPWNLWMRHGAPLQSAGIYHPLFMAGIAGGALALQRPYVPDTAPGHLACPNYPGDLVYNEEYAVGGDRGTYWKEQDLRPAIAKSHVPIFFTNGMSNGEGHILQFDGLWDLLPTHDKRMLVGQWGHAYPGGAPLGSTLRPDFPAMAVAWFDHYLRGGPALVEPGVVEYQDAQRTWHVTHQWPPASNASRLFLSEDKIVARNDQVRASSQTFQSVYRNPGLEECGFQALYASPPLENDVFLAGYFHVNLTLTSTLPDGNLAAFLFATQGPGTCPDASATEIRRALYDLRHVRTEAGENFPVNTPTKIGLQSYPFATTVQAGSRLVLAVGGDSTSLFPEPRKPLLTVSTGPGVVAELSLPVVEGDVAFQGPTGGDGE